MPPLLLLPREHQSGLCDQLVQSPPEVRRLVLWVQLDQMVHQLDQ